MVLKSRHETRATDKETIRYDSVYAFISFRTFTDDFDYNLRFLILEVLVRVLYDHVFRLLYSTSTFHSTRLRYEYSYTSHHTAAALRVQYEYRVLLKASSIFINDLQLFCFFATCNAL